MTKEQIIDNLELYTVGRPKKDQVSITVEELQNLINEIKALEQQPSEDCMSRAEVKKIAKEMYLEVANMDLDVHTISDCISYTSSKCRQVLENKLQSLPSVTPTQCIAVVRFSKEDLRDICNERIEIECTHGTCKDCKNAIESHYNKCICCTRLGCNCDNDFYCKDFEKRGDSDGSN